MDVLIPILLGLVQAALAFLGGWVSLKKLNDAKRKRFLLAFLALAALGVGLTVWQAVLAKGSSEESTRNTLGDAERPPFVTEISLPDFTRFVVSNGSSYPAYGIRIRLYDDTIPSAPPVLVREYNYAEMAAHSGLIDDKAWIPPDDAARRHFVADISSRTGVYREELILQQAGNSQWERAARVMQGMTKLEEDIDSAWPREPDGDIRWGR